jgi:hypothetical protein
MRRPSRTRRVLKWVGTVLCGVLMLPYAFSGYRLQWTQLDGGHTVRMHNGYIQYGWASGGVRFGRIGLREGQRFRVSRVPYWPVLLWPPVYVFRNPPGSVRVMFWLPLLLVATATAFLWYRDRRPPPGFCRRCGYNLTGNVSGICPECGTPVKREGKPA